MWLVYWVKKLFFLDLCSSSPPIYHTHCVSEKLILFCWSNFSFIICFQMKTRKCWLGRKFQPFLWGRPKDWGINREVTEATKGRAGERHESWRANVQMDTHSRSLAVVEGHWGGPQELPEGHRDNAGKLGSSTGVALLSFLTLKYSASTWLLQSHPMLLTIQQWHVPPNSIRLENSRLIM